ncbi:MAG TPA: glycosyltransferase family 2 protein [Candidatus Omnitrophota bacterium]|nr:glycosyltransferase family 2 protein [Candidatus Omnitrophota bacterium]
MLLSIVFSFRNEAEVFEELIKRVRAVAKHLSLDYEMIFVNDDSTDNSLDILLKEREKDPAVKIINMSRCFGVHQCALAGLRAASGDAVVYMDCDLQDPPEVIPAMVEKWRNGAEIVHSTRTKRKGENPVKLFLTGMAYRFLNLISETKILPNSGDFKLLSRRAVSELVRLEEYDPFMRGLVHWIGFKQENVFYEREARHKGQTHFPLLGWGPMKEFERGVITFSAAPLRLSLFLGFAISFLSFACFVVILLNKLLGRNDMPGWTAIMSSIFFLNGIVLFTIGVFGLYLGRIYRDVAKRPNYIIRNSVGL